jgi:hypothetical protein
LEERHDTRRRFSKLKGLPKLLAQEETLYSIVSKDFAEVGHGVGREMIPVLRLRHPSVYQPLFNGALQPFCQLVGNLLGTVFG